MYRLDKIYRANYLGENVTTLARYRGGTWEYASEWVPLAVENRQTSGVATAIGNGISRKNFELNLLFGHKAGVLGSKSMQTYGCNGLYRDGSPTFMVASTEAMCAEMVSSGYCDNHIVYANSRMVMKYPGKFYLIPQDVQANAGTLAAYLACFDGHEKVYLLGFDGQWSSNVNNNIYADTNAYNASDINVTDNYQNKTLSRVMSTYSEVEFVRVCPTQDFACPDEWKSLPNFRQIDFWAFVLEADL